MIENQTPLESWKEIAGYLQKDITTVRRWERMEGLPVHRHTHNSRSSVYAYPGEIDDWRAGRKVVLAPAPVRPLWKIPTFALTMVLCLVTVGNGIRPQVASAQGASAPAARQVWVSSNLDPSNGAPSADGRYMSVTDWETGDLMLRDLVAGTSRRLTNTGGWAASGDYTESTLVSPDGQRVAYAWFIQKDSTFELRVIPTASGTPRTLYRTQSGGYMRPYNWTSDGKRILVLNHAPDHTTWQIAMLSVDDGSLRVIKSLGWQSSNARLSPDERFIAYDRVVDEKTSARDIFVLATDGSREAALVESPSNDSTPLWSPEGVQVLFTSNRTGPESLWAVPVRDGKPNGPAAMVRADLAGKQPLGITPAGVLYYLAQGPGGMNVYVADLDSTMKVTQPPRIAAERFMNSNSGPAISPDGAHLAYYSNRPGQGLVVVVRDLKTGEEQDIAVQQTLVSRFGAGPMWFGDSRSVLVTSTDPQRPGTTFLRVNIADGKAALIHHHNRGLQGWALSPDGKSLYKAENLQGPSQLVRVDLETKQETVLKRDTWVISVSVSPDSQQVAYLVSGLPNAGSRLEVMPATGGEARVVYSDSPWLSGDRYSGLGWTADGKSLLFVRGGVSTERNVLWRVPVSGGQPQPTGLSREGSIKVPQAHRNGRQVYFGSNDAAPGELWALENFLRATTRP